MKNQNVNIVAINIVKVLLAAIALFLSVQLLTVNVEAEPGIAYDTANTSSDAVDLITRSNSVADALYKSAVVAEMKISLTEMQASNEETVGWLLIPNVCYYPIMYSSVYDYYLTHDPNREASAQGSIFINYQCEASFENMLTLIHGHNMKNGAMFGQLEEYLGEDFFNNNSKIMILSDGQLRSYKPFTVVILEENSDVIDARELSDTERISYIESMYNRSVCKLKEGEELDLTKPVIFFSTCNYSFSEARLLVGAYLTQIEEVG